MKHFIYIVTIISLISCSNKKSDKKIDLRAPTAKKAALKYMNFLITPNYGIVSDVGVYNAVHHDEIKETLEIADIDTLKNHVAAFIRFSVGAKIFRNVIYLRKVDGQWIHSRVDTYGYPDNDKIDEWNDQSASKFPDKL